MGDKKIVVFTPRQGSWRQVPRNTFSSGMGISHSFSTNPLPGDVKIRARRTSLFFFDTIRVLLRQRPAPTRHKMYKN
ncbi:hypothetical protein D5086_015048 [Populus alba]|uniref:Uncharacterized protein n=1 Tax=Populus alba TaxID=43335 RepID=A0ACC4C0S3_POPAL